MKLPIVLMYHAVAPCPPNADPEERGLFVEPAAFKRQMDALSFQGYRSLTLDEYAAAVDGRSVHRRAFLLTFDDAYAHVHAAVTPVLRLHGFSAVMFANWAHLGGKNTWDVHLPHLAKLDIASPDQLREMATDSWEIASHGLRHVDLRAVPAPERRADLLEARDRLSRLVKEPVLDLAYPYGYDDPAVRQDVRAAGYRLAFAADYTGSADPLRLSRRAVRGTDSLSLRHLEMAGWSDRLDHVRDRAPDWARSVARNVRRAGRP